VLLTWLGALVVGLSLGLLGSGGSILTVPILVYVIGESPKQAVAASLAIVGVIALAGAASYARKRLVEWRFVVYFGLPGILATYAGAWLSHLVSGAVQLIVFAVIMGLASFTMLRRGRAAGDAQPQRHFAWLLAAGVGVGLITGFVGVGGGFLFVPALVILGGLPMHRAVGTSLAVIALNSASGFVGHYVQLAAARIDIPWTEIATFAVIGTAGSLVGHALGSRFAHTSLRRAFGVLLVVMCAFVLWRTLPQVQR
jgi:uncharacterized membrane protein YfcA